MGDSGGAGFEDVIIESIDATRLAQKVKNHNKRAILIYKSLGYADWEIALNLGISERMVRKHTNWLVDFFKKI
jgi:predicted transcriptional regulator